MREKHSLLISFVSVLMIFVFPVRAQGLDFDITGSLSTGYDDNITRANDHEISDSVTKLSAGIATGREGKTYDLNIKGFFTQHLYARHSSFNNNSQNVNFDFQKELSLYDRLGITNTFVHAEDPGNFEDAFGRPSGRYSYHRNIFTAKYTKDVSRHVSVNGHYTNESYGASDGHADSLSHRAGADAVYLWNSTVAFLLGYQYVTTRIENNGRADVQTVDTGARIFLTSQLYLDGRVGVSFVDGYNGSNTSEPNVVIAITNDFSKTNSATLSYQKTSLPSSDTADIWNAWRVSLSFKGELSERLGMENSIFFFGEGKYETLDIKDKQSGVSTRLNYAVKEDVTAFLGYTYTSVDSNIDSRDYRKNLVEIGITMKF